MSSVNLHFIDFGCGNGRSSEFASSIVAGQGFGIDISDDAVDACRAKGLAAERGDLLEFEQRSVAVATFAINVVQELPGRAAFEQGLVNMIRAARNFAMVQHPFFDADPRLALGGQQIEANFDKKIQYKLTAADYIAFAQRHQEALSLSGMGIFGTGRAEVGEVALEAAAFRTEGEERAAAAVPRSLRVVFGRKDVGRFRAALESTSTGNAFFVWERA
jgi:SAM-dependent methyltransferase